MANIQPNIPAKQNYPVLSPYGFKNNTPSLPMSSGNMFTERISQGRAGSGYGDYPTGLSPRMRQLMYNNAVTRANAGNANAVRNINENYAMMGLGNSGAKGNALTMADLARGANIQNELTQAGITDATQRLQNEQRRIELQNNFDLANQSSIDALTGQAQGQENFNTQFNAEELLKQFQLKQQAEEAQRMAEWEMYMKPYKMSEIARNNSLANKQYNVAMSAPKLNLSSYSRL